MHGTYGRFLDVDLRTGRTSDYEIPERWSSLHLGGKGIALRILMELCPPGAAALAPENVLIFATGPFQGSNVAGGGRNTVVSVSPKTGAPSEAYVGGFFPHELGTSGYDGIIVRGRSPQPVYILLENGRASLEDATSLWGRDVGFVDRTLKEKHKGVRVSAIGLAGENSVRFACILNDRNRAAGRPGFGAVMGSKQLKAVAVRGGLQKPYHNPERLKSLAAEYARNLMSDPVAKLLHAEGTAFMLEPLNAAGILPTRYFRDGSFAHAHAIGGEAVNETLLVRRNTCTGCPVACKPEVEAKVFDTDVSSQYGGPEYETLAAFGSLCLVDDLGAIALANQKCNAYGLDTISTGSVLAFLMQLTEEGLVEEGLQWGDAESVLQLVDSIAERKGLGDQLAEGVRRFASEVGVDSAVEVKGVSAAMHDPRGKKGLGISYAASPRGATHLEGFHDSSFASLPAPIEELGLMEPRDPLSWQEKGILQARLENLQSFTNSLVMCRFVSFLRVGGSTYPYPEIRDLLSAMTGMPVDATEMLAIGERNFALAKLLAAESGLTREDDRLPLRLMAPLENGPLQGESISAAELDAALEEYYEVRGYDDYGPTAETLSRLGLAELVGRRHSASDAPKEEPRP